MKALFTLMAISAFSVLANAQTLKVAGTDLTYYYPINGEELPFGDGNSITLWGKTFNLGEFPSMKVINDSPVEENQVLVTYTSGQATVAVHGSIANFIDIAVQNGHVTIAQSDEVSENTCGEITYILKGESSNGSFNLSGNYKSSIELAGLTLTNPTGATIDIQNGKRISVSAKKDTENVLVDGSGSQKAALYCKGHLELKGKGKLTVTGNQSHAISAKEYITIKNLTLDVQGALKDGINCNQYFTMESGTVTINNTSDDGIQVSFKDDTDREAEDTGTFNMIGGSLNINIAKGEASKGIKADGDVKINGGEIDIVTSCQGVWDSKKLKTKASSCIGADGDIDIDGGIFNLTATGSGGKGISCDGVFTSNGGEINITTSGGMLVYSNGNLNHNYTGNSDYISSDYKSSAKGIKADSGMVINDGNFTIYTSTNNAEGLESKETLDINGGNIYIKAYDDGINSSSDLTITGGKVTVLTSAGDAIDSNANMYIKGGEVVALGAGGAEQGLDAADENGCYIYITGGKVLCFGGRTSPVRQTTGSQALVTISGSITANNEVSVQSGSTSLGSFTIPSEYLASQGGVRPAPGGGGWGPGGTSGAGSIMISLPELISGASYTVKNGTSTSTSTAKTTSS